MNITSASLSDLDGSIACLVTAFAQDPITGFLLQPGPGYPERLAQFFSLLMRARITLKMPVVVARGSSGIDGAVMGYATAHPAWPKGLTEEWDRFESAIPALTERMAAYDEVAAKGKPPAPHYYLGVIGVHPDMHGRGVGTQLLRSFCELSRSDPLSCGVYLETAQESNVRFYERAGFEETARGRLGRATLWCMYRPRGRDDA
jgi:ribosomal protein S18 acetylase RimI-like enzyme